MNRNLWLFVPLCSALTLIACGGRPDTCVVDGDCFADEKCVASKCELTAKPDAGKTDDDAGTTGGGTAADAGPTTGGGDGVTGGGTGGGSAVDSGSPDCSLGESRACCGGRGEQTCDNGAWTACDATVSAESCNGVDDDCNGTVDNDVLFAMPDGGVAANVSCSIGVGACLSNGSLACGTDGGVECGAQVIQPTTEICDGIDNDCDGDTDESTKVLCMVDSDNDHYAGALAQSEFCPDTTRPEFGNCPLGYVATSLGVDCNDADPTRYTEVSIRVDGDGDRYCKLAPATTDCTDGSAPAGSRLANSCEVTPDCDDMDSNLFQNLPGAPDSDNDGACTGSQQSVCSGATLRTGFTAPGSCRPDVDCEPMNPYHFRIATIATDADQDTHCVGTSRQACIGLTPDTGTLLSDSCVDMTDCDDTNRNYYRALNNMYADKDNDLHCTGTAQTKCVGGIAIRDGYKAFDLCLSGINDCNDDIATIYDTVSVRSDGDHDQYCLNDAADACVGTTLPAGKRLARLCNATPDCNDTNSKATGACYLNSYSNEIQKTCGVGQSQSFTYNFYGQCPDGFHATGGNFVRTDTGAIQTNPQAGYIAINGTPGQYLSNNMTFTCVAGAIGGDYWRLRYDCSDDASYP